MKKQIAYLCSVVLFSVAGISETAKDAQAEEAVAGPYYVYFTGYCDVAKLYVTPRNILFGSNINCPAPSSKYNYGGSFVPESVAGLGYSFSGADRIQELDLKRDDMDEGRSGRSGGSGGTWITWINNGTSLTLFNSGTWVLGPAPDPVLGGNNAALPSMND
jgi:hypothetical protein